VALGAVTRAFYIKRPLSIMARSAGQTSLHVRHCPLGVRLDGHDENFGMALGALQTELSHVKIMAVQDVACSRRMKNNVPAAYLSPRSKRHKQQNQHSRNDQLSHCPPPLFNCRFLFISLFAIVPPASYSRRRTGFYPTSGENPRFLRSALSIGNEIEEAA
jgi:hypothetical protein